MAHRFTSLLTHLVFSTKDRFPHLYPDLAPECHAYLGGIIEQTGGRRVAIGGANDHVHVLLDLPATQSVADCIRTLKSNSSKWIHEKWPRRSKFAWQKGYAAFSVSRSTRERVIEYIRTQEEHHRQRSYQDEVRRFLKQHGWSPTNDTCGRMPGQAFFVFPDIGSGGAAGDDVRHRPPCNRGGVRVRWTAVGRLDGSAPQPG